MTPWRRDVNGPEAGTAGSPPIETVKQPTAGHDLDRRESTQSRRSRAKSWTLIRSRWPTTRILFRGDSHYAQPEAMAWCEDNNIDYAFGLSRTKPLSKKVDETADAVRTERALDDKAVVRGYAETRHKAKSWTPERRAVARVEATGLGLDVRFVVTNLDYGSTEWIYDSLYCARGQAENLIRLHKSPNSPRTAGRAAQRSYLGYPHMEAVNIPDGKIRRERQSQPRHGPHPAHFG